MDQLRCAIAGSRQASGGTLSRVSGLVLIALAALSGLACETRAARRTGAGLGLTFDSPEQVVTALLEALAAKDVDGLQALALSQPQFETVIWPELPSSRPEVNLPMDYVWGTLHQNSRASLAMTLSHHGGRAYRLLRLHTGPHQTRYASFTVHRDVTLVVQDDTEAERELSLFGSLVEQDGRWKIFSFVVD